MNGENLTEQVLQEQQFNGQQPMEEVEELQENSQEEYEEYEGQEKGQEEDEEMDDKENINLDAENILEYIEVLNQHRQKCQEEGNYIEAELAKNKIKELKLQHEQSQKEELKAGHLNEKLEMEETHLEEFNEFNQVWDQRMDEFKFQADELENEMVEKHKQELEEFVEALNNSLPQQPKRSTELLNMRKIELNLVKQQDYLEAHKVQQICVQLEKKEFIKWQQSRLNKINHQKTQLEQKQNIELSALKKKIDSGQEEQQKSRSKELEKLLQKYQNLKSELGKRQKMEILSFDKRFKNPTSSASVYGRMSNSRYGGSRYGGGSVYSKKSNRSKRQRRKN